jgi:hypothetical protein
MTKAIAAMPPTVRRRRLILLIFKCLTRFRLRTLTEQNEGVLSGDRSLNGCHAHLLYTQHLLDDTAFA